MFSVANMKVVFGDIYQVFISEKHGFTKNIFIANSASVLRRIPERFTLQASKYIYRQFMEDPRMGNFCVSIWLNEKLFWALSGI